MGNGGPQGYHVRYQSSPLFDSECCALQKAFTGFAFTASRRNSSFQLLRKGNPPATSATQESISHLQSRPRDRGKVGDNVTASPDSASLSFEVEQEGVAMDSSYMGDMSAMHHDKEARGKVLGFDVHGGPSVTDVNLRVTS